MTAAAVDPTTYPSLTAIESAIVKQIYEFTKEFFQNPRFDSSHDFNHVMRVVSNAIYILEQEELAAGKGMNDERAAKPRCNAFIVILGALLHDVDDKKYVDDSKNGISVAEQELIRIGMSELEAQKIRLLVEGVSYSTECKNPEHVETLIREIPELAVVQDADRLDAIGAIGIARCFTFGGAKRARTLESSVEHFVDKLVRLESMMKTKTGRIMATERTKRLREFMSWWDEETGNRSQ